MAYDKVVDSSKLDAGLKTIADAIREKAGISDDLAFPSAMAEAIASIKSGGANNISLKDVNFYDYDGELLHAYTLEEAQALSELPELPTHDGLICQGWNYDLETIKEHNRAVNVGAMYITDDGATRIYIHLEEGRTSPMLGVCPNGTITVDWGDGTTPDTLTGTSTSTVKWTPTHEYSEAGDYIIRLTVNGTFSFYGSSSINQYSGILRHSSTSNTLNKVYLNSVQKIEIGNGITSMGNHTFSYCNSLKSVVIPNNITSIGTYAFNTCYSLKSVVIPNSVTFIGNYVFSNCSSLESVVMSNNVTSISDYIFRNCYSLKSVVIPNNVTSIDTYAFYSCYSLTLVVIPNSVTSITSYAFSDCYGVKYYDFTSHTSVPALSNTNAFTGISSDCEIRVPAALVDEWKAATNWATYAGYIVGV